MSPQAVQTDAPAESIGERIAALSEDAKKAFNRQDYRGALAAIDRIPEPKRTPEVEVLRSRCLSLRKSQQACEAAARAFGNGDYDEAVKLLERVPLVDRTPEGSALLEEARSMAVLGPILLAARDAISNRDYAYAVEVLESVPPEQRSREHLDLLSDAHTRLRRLRELREQAENLIDRAIAERDRSLAEKAVAAFEEVVELAPPDDPAGRRLEDARKLPQRIEELLAHLSAARKAFESRDYEQTVRHLTNIAPELRDREIQDLLEDAERRQARILELLKTIREGIASRSFGSLNDHIVELGELVDDPVDLVLEQVPAGDVQRALGDLVEATNDEPQLLGLIEAFISRIEMDKFVSFLPEQGQELLEHYPPGGCALPAKLIEILDALAESGEKFYNRLDALQFARGHLGDAEECLLNWERCLALLAELDEIQKRRWSWRETLIENEHSQTLDETASRFAEAAALVLPPGHEGWESLGRVFGSHFREKAFLVRRVYAKIERYLETGAWPTWSITVITLRRAMTAAFTLVLLTIAGALVQTLLASLFNVGGASGYALVFFLASLWTFFYVAANRIL